MAQPIRRRTVVRGAAWATPAVVVAAAAPAFAVSPSCLITERIDWGAERYARTSATTGTYTTADPDGAGPLQPLTVTVQTALGSNTNTGSQKYNGITTTDPQSCTCDDNLRVSTHGVGGTSDSGLTLHQSPAVNANKSRALTDANKSTTRFTFSRPVTNLSFTITDVDSATSDFWDAVAIESASGFAGTVVDSGQVSGTGAVVDPWTPDEEYREIPDSSANGNVRVQFPGPVTSFDLHYWNATAGSSIVRDGDQRVFLSDFTLTYNAC